MADDLGYGDLGCYGQKLIKTPRIDSLAEQGVRFTQAYAGGPVCASSRSVLMTGLHNGHTPARDNVPHYHTYLKEDDITVAERLKHAGYRTGGVGKWSLGDAGTVGRATNQGFDTWFGYLNQDHAHYYYPEYLDDDEARHELKGNTSSRKHYSHDLLTERALKFIREPGDQPFFLYVAYTVPHFAAKDEDPNGFTVPSTAPYTDRDWDERSKKYAAMVHLLDRDVGRIVDLVEEQGIGENTLIIFTSDNGGHKVNGKRFQSSGPLRGYKRDLTEGGTRVPFIARLLRASRNSAAGPNRRHIGSRRSARETAQNAAKLSLLGLWSLPWKAVSPGSANERLERNPVQRHRNNAAVRFVPRYRRDGKPGSLTSRNCRTDIENHGSGRRAKSQVRNR